MDGCTPHPVRAAVLAVVLGIGLIAAPGSAKEKYTRTEEQYTVPEVTLVDQDGKRVALRAFIEESEVPVMVDFIYGTCTTICPVLSAGYSAFQRRVGTDKARLISFSIDPEHDTPEVMTTYLKRYKAQEGWDFFTGTRDDMDRVMRAFGAYVENKMSHYPITFLKAPGSDVWVRIYGLLGSRDLIREYELLLPAGQEDGDGR